MANETNKVENKMLREVVDNFLGCIKSKIYDTINVAPWEFIQDTLDYCYQDNYIRPMMMTDSNEDFVSRHAMEIQRCMLYIERDFSGGTLSEIYQMFEKYSISRYVIDVHHYTIMWFMDTYNIYDIIAERLGLNNVQDEFELTDETFKVITEVFEEKIEEHGDEYLFY